MSLFSYKPSDELLRRVAEQYRDELQALVEALLAGDADVDIKLAETLEGMRDQERVALVEQMRAMLRARDEEKARAVDQWLTQQKIVERQRSSQMMQQWLSYVMSEQTLRKIREAMLSSPTIRKEIEQAGQDLAKKGVLQQMQQTSPQELGGLSVNANQTKASDKSRER